jgi:hypothetical protein
VAGTSALSAKVWTSLDADNDGFVSEHDFVVRGRRLILLVASGRPAGRSVASTL